MKLQGRELELGMTGADVHLLHFELQLIGYIIPDPEVEENHFGQVTEGRVQSFQGLNGLEATGVVDEATAAAINEVVRETVSVDVVLDRLEAEIVGCQARVDELRQENRDLRADISGLRTDNSGLRQDVQRLRETLKALELEYERLEEEAEASAQRVVTLEASLADALARIEDLEALLGIGDGAYVVRGRVVSHERQGLSGLLVVAVDANVGRIEALGEATTTDATGRYQIPYDVASLRERGKQHPDVQIRVLPPGGGVRPMAMSDIRYNAGQVEIIDVMVPAGELQRPAEYSRLRVGLRDHFEGQFGDLQETNGRKDISYLANKTGWDARMVAMLALADQFSARSGIDPEFSYALFRAGLPANDDVLSQIDPEMVGSLWGNAFDDAVLPEYLRGQIPEQVERFRAFSVDRLLTAPAGVGVSSLKELLNVSLGSDDADETRFAQLYYDNRAELDSFWDAVRVQFGDDTTDRLQLDGRLAYLTVNNAGLMEHLHAGYELRTPLDLVREGFYRPEKWEDVLGGEVAVPQEIPGQDAAEKTANYADFMANQLRLSYPTAVVAEMLNRDEIQLEVEPAVKEAVYTFLADHQGGFELGVQPVEQYLKQHGVALDDRALAQVKSLQRVYQISPSDEVMGRLIENRIDSAYAVVQYDEAQFVEDFGDSLGGESAARLTYAKAHQVHNAVLNIASSYLLHRSAPQVYAINAPSGVDGADGQGGGVSALASAAAANVIAYPTLEGLFGEMDYCACEHCRSVLSPAAYLVDLLLFADRGPSDGDGENPLAVLLERRPDIEHLALTCENTNTALPYIDLVNEILEYFVVNGIENNDFSLQNFTGHNIEEGVTTEDLLANPQFVEDTAYVELRDSQFPLALPFHQPLEALRRYFDHFDAPLHEVMEGLRQDDSLERAGDPEGPAYAWRDILMERLGVSRPEHDILTNRSTPLQQLYGEDPATVTEDELVNQLSNVKYFARKVGISYEELIEIIRAQFINPHSHLIPKLEKLSVTFATIKAFIDGSLAEEDFEALLPTDLDTAQYGGDVKQWIRDNANRIMGLIVLSNPTGGEDVCSFEQFELRYALPDFDNNRLGPVEFLKLLRFVRLWRKLGWSIRHTDKAIAALFPAEQRPGPEDDADSVKEKLDTGFKVLVQRLGHLKQVMEALELKPQRDLVPLLALWSPIDTHGMHSLYHKMFLNPSILRLDDVFKEDGYGNFLKNDTGEKITGHTEAVRAAFSLTQDELVLILDDVIEHDHELEEIDQIPLTLDHLSTIFRHGYLARRLRLSVQEFLALKVLSGVDPFGSLSGEDPSDLSQYERPAVLRYIDLVELIRGSGFNISQVLYYLQNQDLSGKASPTRDSVLAFAKALRDDLMRIEGEHRVEDDPSGEVARAKMALAFGSEAVDTFFGLLNGTSLYTVAYDHRVPELEADIRAVTDKIAYDDFRKQLSFRGVMTEAVKAGLENASSATNEFRAAVGALYDAAQMAFGTFFDRFPGLKALYDSYEASDQPVAQRMSELLAKFLPDLVAKLKRLQMREALVAGLDAESSMAEVLLETSALLHADARPDESAIADFLDLGMPGVSVGDGDATVGGVWRWYLEAPDNGFYKFMVEADADAAVSLTLYERQVRMSQENGVWQNQDPIELKAGHLNAMQLTVDLVPEAFPLKWESEGLARETIPPQYLYPADLVDHFAVTYIRLLKALAISEELPLSPAEVVHLGTHSDFYVNKGGWLNSLPAAGAPDAATANALFESFAAHLRYARLKTDLNVTDDVIINLFEHPNAVTEGGGSLLGQVTGWATDDVDALLGRFGWSRDGLAHLGRFLRVKQAFDFVKTLGVRSSVLLDVTTNEPDAGRVRDLQSALRARYDEGDWREVLRPISDVLRGRQRDALVAYVLHRLGQEDATDHIDTPDKLFEYFLIDVEMDPCMMTSRIKQALSSVQLFIQRCLLNLEKPRISPSSIINARRWEWMKRYRVWEANRKVFLFPENWLEPELRDDKSPFFRDLESELLQGDITDDAAATALVHYLEKLDDVAKLEICGMYYDEEETDNAEDDVVHVIARTAGARRQYYYRRLEGSFWTPWERVNLDIEDNPVLPVVWRGRLFLFWLSVSQEGPTDQKPPIDTSSTVLTLANTYATELGGEADIEVKVTLYWSERYNGKWQPPKTSDVNRPISLGKFAPAGTRAFDRAGLRLNSSETESTLQISVVYGDSGSYFELFNTHSLPVPAEDDDAAFVVNRLFLPPRGFSVGDGPFVISYDPRFGGTLRQHYGLNRQVLDNATLFDVIEPRHAVRDIYTAPFFFQDRRHVFFVGSEKSPVSVARYVDYGILLKAPKVKELFITPIEVKPVPGDLVIAEEFVFPPLTIQPGLVNPNPVEFFLNQNVYVNQAIGTAGTVQYGDVLIGPGGSITPEEFK